jgi:hypothetical protein
VPTGFSRKELQLMYRSFKQVNHEARQPLFFLNFTFTADLNFPGVDFAWLLSSERGAILFSTKIWSKWFPDRWELVPEAQPEAFLSSGRLPAPGSRLPAPGCRLHLHKTWAIAIG